MMKSILLNSYSRIQSLGSYRKFGKGSIIKYPAKVWNKSHIELGNRVFIAEGSFLSVVIAGDSNPSLIISDDVCIGANVHISCIESVRIEKKVLISDRVFIGDCIHDYRDINIPIIDQPMKAMGVVVIEQGAFVGINAVILPGVTVGKHSVVAASAVVTKNVPSYSVVAGNPARVIKQYDGDKGWIAL